MSRPLLITDCDEVLLHMLSHFTDWLAEDHRIRFDLDSGQFAEAMTDQHGVILAPDRVWPLLDDFFRTQMTRQTLVPGAIEALGRIGEEADIVILTNLSDEAHPWRVEQLASHGIKHDLVCNQGGKGRAVRRILGRYEPGAAVFVDDLAIHHQSVAKHAPHVRRLHMVAEPRIARAVEPAPHAHARIDDWPAACDWVLSQLKDGA